MNIHTSGEKLSYVEQYLEPLKEHLTDEYINELVINPNGSIFVEKAGDIYMHEIDTKLPSQAIKRLGVQLAGDTKNMLGAQHPIVSGLASVWGKPMRVQVVIEPAIDRGVSLSIRKYMTHILDNLKIEFLGEGQTRVEEERRGIHRKMADLAAKGELQQVLRQAVDRRLNILISGGTSSGKTTVARSLLAMCDQQERIVTIEDAQELFPPHPNYVGLISERREKSERLPSKLLVSSLRMRPDRIILGEVRGEEAYDFLEAINTGHPGAITTIHADSPVLAFDRLALMVMRSGIQMTHSEIIYYARRTIDMVIQVGRRNGKRGVLEIYLPSNEID